MDPIQEFELEKQKRILSYAHNEELKQSAEHFLNVSVKNKYSYNFNWLGRPIIQYPNDIVLMQELIWKIKPDLIIETGIAHGGSLIFSASMLALIDYCEKENKNRQVLGIDIDIRKHNKTEILNHPLSHLITMFEGSSIDLKMAEKVKNFAQNYSTILLFLDSNHTFAHVLKELELYAPLVSENSYCVVLDTIVETLQPDSSPEPRPWHKGNSPMTAVHAFLKNHPEFEMDPQPFLKTLISVAENGFLHRKMGGGGSRPQKNKRFCISTCALNKWKAKNVVFD